MKKRYERFIKTEDSNEFQIALNGDLLIKPEYIESTIIPRMKTINQLEGLPSNFGMVKFTVDKWAYLAEAIELLRYDAFCNNSVIGDKIRKDILNKMYEIINESLEKKSDV